MHAFYVLLAFLHLALASPPACLLGALQLVPNPADLAAVCGTYQKTVEGNLTQVCSGADLVSAFDVYSSNCEAKGVTVAALPTTSSASGPAKATATTTGSAKATGTSSSTNTAAAASASGKSGGISTTPQPLLFAISGLVATGLTGLLFL